MPKKQNNKPSEPFGYVAFSRDGCVRQVINRLPSDNGALELEVGKRFAAALGNIRNRNYMTKQLPKDDHDLMLASCDGNLVVLQLTELSRWDIASPAAAKLYQTVTPGAVLPADLWVDVSEDAAIRASALLKVIQRKLEKHYAKTKDPLWLIIWSTASDYAPFYVSGGNHQISEAVVKARAYLDVREGGATPFSEVWYFDLNVLLPKRIWPLE